MLNKLSKKLTRYWDINLFSLIFPQQRWAHKVIPRHFTDIDVIIENVTFAALVNYWDNDDGRETIYRQFKVFDEPDDYLKENMPEEDIQKNRDDNKQMFDEMAAAYAWAKDRTILRDKINELNVLLFNARKAGYKIDIGATAFLETFFQENDTLHLSNIIKRRQSLWS